MKPEQTGNGRKELSKTVVAPVDAHITLFPPNGGQILYSKVDFIERHGGVLVFQDASGRQICTTLPFVINNEVRK